MSTPRVIAKATGHVGSIALASDLRYLDETTSRGNWQFIALGPGEIKNLIGKKRRIFIAEPSGRIERLPAEKLPGGKRTGNISENYAARLEEMQREGKIIYERVVTGVKELDHEHGFALARERGAVVPLTWTAQVQAQEMGWNETLPASAGRPLLSRLMRENIRGRDLTRRAVKTMSGGKKTGRDIAAHNLVVAPHPQLLERIRRDRQPIDKVLETAARLAVEKMERRCGAKIVAVCSTHLQDSNGVRPHLHIRMSAYDSNGKYVALFDRKAGGSGGGRCVLQNDIEREMLRTIERREPRERS